MRSAGQGTCPGRSERRTLPHGCRAATSSARAAWPQPALSSSPWGFPCGCLCGRQRWSQYHTPLIPLYRPVLGARVLARRVEPCRRGSFARRRPAGAENHECGTRSPAPTRCPLCSLLGILITKHIDRSGQITLARSSPTHYHPNERRASGSWSLEMANAVTGAVEQGGDNGTTPRRNTIKQSSPPSLQELGIS